MALPFVALVATISADSGVLPYVPVIFGGYDLMEYWQSNKSINGSLHYPLNITSKDQDGIERVYQLQFSTQSNLDYSRPIHLTTYQGMEAFEIGGSAVNFHQNGHGVPPI
eukprot:1094044_1